MFWAALWGPTAAMITAIVVAAISMGPACSSVKGDVAAIREAFTVMSERVQEVDADARAARTEAATARTEAANAMAKARRNEYRLDETKH